MTYLLSLIAYAIPANLFGIAILVAGKNKVQWLKGEYFAIYALWFVYIALVEFIFGGVTQFEEKGGIAYIFLIAQAAAAGILGGLTLLGRVFVPATTTSKKITVLLFSIILAATLYIVIRAALFAAIGARLST